MAILNLQALINETNEPTAVVGAKRKIIEGLKENTESKPEKIMSRKRRCLKIN